MCSPLKQQTKSIITKEVGDPQTPEGQWTALEVASDSHHAAGDPGETPFYKKNVKDMICDKVDLLGELSKLQQVFIEHLPCSGHFPRHWDCRGIKHLSRSCSQSSGERLPELLS